MRRESIHDVNIPAGMTEKSRGSMTKDDGLDLAASRSIDEVQAIEMQEGKHGQFHRSFTPRQVHIIALGSNIGSGVFIATGKALATGGPGNMVIAYFMVCSCVWAVLQSLSEMTIAFPVSGNYIDYADRWVDPALAFGAGFAEWLGWTAIVSAEAGFFHILVGYWSGGSFPLAASLSIFMFACLVIFLLPNTVFAWFEYVTSLIKIFLFLIIITLSLALVLGAGPNGYVHHGETWTDLPAFLNGFSGFANCALLATWAVGDQVFIGIMGGEAESPRFSLAHATKLVPFRVNFIYMLSVVFITILVPSNDPRLLGGGGVAASPFVVAVTDSGIPGISSLLNAGMICGVLAIAAESVYLSSRVLRTMAHQGLISTRLAHVDDKGRPRLALIITSVVAVVLGYIQLSAGGLTVLNWLISITSASFFTNWIIISFTNYRFHCALKAQNDKLFSETYAWRSSAWPIAPAWLMLISVMLLVCCIYSGIKPVGGAGFSASNFFQYMIGVLVIFGFTAGYKVIFRTPWRDPATADCLTGRRHLSVDEIKQLDEYYAKPKWRRFLTYVQLW
ncbi:amino acid transport GAP1 [Fusarium pseudocircinatum]|uniref:Amino acid transport GAP1 n=2 Tax=Fusarium fujikuroi species complex TaxID=171627 RepID=A0A8H5Q144_9HYPO|nr:amino acid transport GAP1 [Fusarium pseudocircinatum]KAF5687461.1 amino acid transporter [Fusarium denticulatum]